MALWGNKDNIASVGTVSVNYGTRVVTGSNGCDFENVAAVGDIIRFGTPFGGVDGYSGEAVIASIGGTTQLTIESTAGLSGGEITSVDYQLSQSPKWVPTNAAANQSQGLDHTGERFKIQSTVKSRVAIAATVIPVNFSPEDYTIVAGDLAEWYGHVVAGLGSVYGVINDAATSGIGTILVTAGISTTNLKYHNKVAKAIGVGTVRVYRTKRDHHALNEIKVGDTFKAGTNSIGIGTISKHSKEAYDLTLNTALTQAVTVNQHVDIARGIAPDSGIIVWGKETVKGMEYQTIGIAQTGVTNAAGTRYQLTSAGWVGITTYTDGNGVDRVKTETLVAMSGIHTGVSYPPTT